MPASFLKRSKPAWGVPERAFFVLFVGSFSLNPKGNQ